MTFSVITFLLWCLFPGTVNDSFSLYFTVLLLDIFNKAWWNCTSQDGAHQIVKPFGLGAECSSVHLFFGFSLPLYLGQTILQHFLHLSEFFCPHILSFPFPCCKTTFEMADFQVSTVNLKHKKNFYDGRSRVTGRTQRHNSDTNAEPLWHPDPPASPHRPNPGKHAL